MNELDYIVLGTVQDGRVRVGPPIIVLFVKGFLLVALFALLYGIQTPHHAHLRLSHGDTRCQATSSILTITHVNSMYGGNVPHSARASEDE